MIFLSPCTLLLRFRLTFRVFPSSQPLSSLCYVLGYAVEVIVHFYFCSPTILVCPFLCITLTYFRVGSLDALFTLYNWKGRNRNLLTGDLIAPFGHFISHIAQSKQLRRHTGNPFLPSIMFFVGQVFIHKPHFLHFRLSTLNNLE